MVINNCKQIHCTLMTAQSTCQSDQSDQFANFSSVRTNFWVASGLPHPLDFCQKLDFLKSVILKKGRNEQGRGVGRQLWVSDESEARRTPKRLDQEERQERRRQEWRILRQGGETAVRQCFKLIFCSIQIEDDNRKAHVKFRKENPIFYEQVSIF